MTNKKVTAVAEAIKEVAKKYNQAIYNAEWNRDKNQPDRVKHHEGMAEAYGLQYEYLQTLLPTEREQMEDAYISGEFAILSPPNTEKAKKVIKEIAQKYFDKHYTQYTKQEKDGI